MRVGVDLPYFEDPGEIRAFVQGVEDMDFHHLGFSEHLCSTLDSDYPAPFFTFDEPWRESFTLASFVAAVTDRIELNPSMVLLPLYPPVLAAKQAAEVANLSAGRLRMGASIGWNSRECRALGVDPVTRGARFEEQVEILRRLLTERSVDHVGRFFELSQTGISARPAEPIPLWFGAGNLRDGGFPGPVGIARAARLADGFKFIAPTGQDPDRVAATVEHLRTDVRSAGRDPDDFGIEARIVLQATTPDEWPELFAEAHAIGASHLGLANRIAGGSVEEQLSVCQQFVEATKNLW